MTVEQAGQERGAAAGGTGDEGRAVVEGERRHGRGRGRDRVSDGSSGGHVAGEFTEGAEGVTFRGGFLCYGAGDLSSTRPSLMSAADFIVGIDLGTTNSLVGAMDAGFPILLADEAGGA